MRDNCGMVGHFARYCRKKGKGNGKGGDEGKGYVKDKGKDDEGQANFWDPMWDIQENRKVGDVRTVLEVR